MNRNAIISTLAIIVCSLLTVGARAQNYPEGMIAYWKFDEGAGTVARDMVGGHDGIVTGAQWTTGRVNAALAFDRIDDIVSIPHHPDLNFPTNTATFEAWVNWGEHEWSDYVILSKEATDPIDYTHQLRYGYQFRLINSKLSLVICDGSGYADAGYLVGPPWFPGDSWHHVVAVYSDEGNFARLYQDAVLLAENTAFNTSWDNSGNTSPLTIGAWSSALYGVCAVWKGIIDEVAIYNRVLSPQEIAQHYQNGLNGKGYETPSLPPTVTSFSPTSGNVGTMVTITGTNFNSMPADNIVYFGAVRGTVISATSTTLDVIVPFGATYSPISVTDITSHLTAYSSAPFTVTFASNQVIDETSISPIPALATGTNPHLVSVVDFDGDGRSDIVVSNIGSASVSVFNNISVPGSLVFESKTDVAVGNGPRQIAVGDFDGDGRLDLAVANYDAATVSLLRNTSTVGAISFAAKVDLVTGTNPHGVAVGDLDGDGKPDLAVTIRSTNSISVFRNVGTGGELSFAPSLDFAAGFTPFYAAVADIDGDFRPDLVPINYYGNTLSVIRNTSSPGNPSFDQRIDFPTPLYPVGIAIGDIDGDSKPDIAISKVGSNLMSVFRNTSLSGVVSLEANVDFDTDYGPNQIGMSDLDGDGKIDLAVTNVYSDRVAIYRNRATNGSITPNTFPTKVSVPTGEFPMGIAIGDLDNDGKPDLVTGNFEENTISVLRNTVGPARTLTNLGPAELFIGVTNSDNNGRRIDIKLEIFKNGTDEANKLAEGVLGYQQVAGNALNNSKMFTVDLSPVGDVGFADNDVLYARVSVRRVGGSGNFGVRFWYNNDPTISKSRGWSRMEKVTEGGSDANHYYFLSGSQLGTEPNHSGIASVLTATTSYQSFGTWSIQGSMMKPGPSTPMIPSSYALSQNYPNPFNPSTTISFALPVDADVSLIVYDVLGREVATLVAGKVSAGRYDHVFDASNLSSGIYLYRLTATGANSSTFTQTNKMILMK